MGACASAALWTEVWGIGPSRHRLDPLLSVSAASAESSLPSVRGMEQRDAVGNLKGVLAESALAPSPQ